MINRLSRLVERLNNRFQRLNDNGNGHILEDLLHELSWEEPQEHSIKVSTESELDQAIGTSQRYLLSIQNHRDGYWVGELEADSTLTSEYIMLMHFLSRVNHAKQKKAAMFLVKKQLPDGGWNLYCGGPSEVSTTVKAYFALRLAGVPASAPLMQKAKRCVLNLGGIMKVNCFTKIYLAIFGHFDWRGVPAIPVEMILFPNFFSFNVYEMSYWSRCIVIPLSIAVAKRLKSKVGENISLDELYTIPKEKVSYRLERDHNKVTIRNFIVDMNDVFKRYDERPIHILRKFAIKKAEQWMLSHFEKSGGLGAIWPGIVNSIFAMKSLGYSNNHPALLSQIKELERLTIEDKDTLHMQPCVSPVWDTAWAIIALHESGIPKNHPALTKAGQWLLTKEVRKPGDWKLKNPSVEPSGWYFQYENEFYPDTDDSAAVLMALQRIPLSEKSNKEEVLLRALKWLLGMQCDDGGWGAFDRNNNKAVLNYIPFADFGALLDPSTSDVTGRCLGWLGKVGFNTSNTVIQKAIEFLKKDQEPDGSWYGRWGCNYIYGTWSVLYGLQSVGEDMGKEYIQKAVHWLKNVQNSDGGWGERCKSYENPRFKAMGSSTASQTAWAIMGLLAVNEIDCPAMERGIKYLLKTQNQDGTWDEDEFTATGFPRFFYLKYHLYRNYFPLFALASYRRLRSQIPESCNTLLVGSK